MQNIIRKTLEKGPVVRQITPLRSIEKSKRIAVRTKDSIHVIRVDEIIRCLADNNYCTIYYGAGLKIMVAKTLKSVGEVLPSNEFVRVHQSHIVRVSTIHQVFHDHIILHNKESIPMSRDCRKGLMNKLEEIVTYV